MSSTLVIGMYKTGTTIVASVIERSLPGATLYFGTDWELRSAPCDPTENSAYVMKIAEEAFRSRAQANSSA